MANDFIGIKVPCGFGPPGSLPEPLPGGLDGGVVVIPTDPGGGGVVIGPVEPINPGLPPVPGVPVFVPKKPTIIVNNPIPKVTGGDIIIVTDIPVSPSCVVYNNTESYVLQFPGYQTNWVLSFTGLNSNTLYYYTFIVKEQSSLKLKATGIGSFTTLTTPVQYPQIVNQNAFYTSPNTLNITWQTLYNAGLVNTLGSIKVFNDVGLQVYTATSPLNSTHTLVVQGLPLDQTYSIEITSQIPGNGVDTEVVVIDSPQQVSITGINYSQTVNSFTLSWQTVDSLGLASPSKYIATVYGGQSPLVYSSNNSVSNFVLTVNNLTPATLYTVEIANTNDFSSDSRLVSILTNSIPIGEEPTQTEPFFPVEPETPAEFLQIENSQTEIYGQFLFKSAYEESELDLKYTPYRIVPTGFKPVYSQSKTNLFSPIRHRSLENVIKGETTTFEIANLDKENITNEDIKRSLVTNLRQTTLNLVYPNGIPVQESKVINSFKSHILKDTTDNIDVDYLNSLNTISVTPANNSISPIKVEKSEYGKNSKTVAGSRKARYSNAANLQNLTRNSSYGLQLLKKSLKSLDPDVYSDASRELLKLWYFIPSDVNKRFEILLADGTVQTYYVEDNESFQYLTSSLSVSTAYVSINDTIDYLDYNGLESESYAVMDINRARTITNADEQLIKYHLNIEDDILLEINSVNPNIELIADNTVEPDTHYILMLNTSSLSSTTNNYNPFIRETTAKYTLQSKVTSSIEDINYDIKYRAYPWLTVCIDHDDAIIDYFQDASALSNNYQFTFKDLTYNKTGAKFDGISDLLVRKIPKFILVLPSNKTKYNLFNEQSYLVNWTTRRIRFEKSPDPELVNIGLTTHPFTVENTYVNSQGESKSGYFSTQAYHCVYSSSANNYDRTYKDPESKPERLEDSFRKFVKVVSSLGDNYEVNEGLTYYDALVRLDRPDLYTFNSKVSEAVILDIEAGSINETPLFHVKGPTGKSISARRSGTRLISLIENGEEVYAPKYSGFDIINAEAEVAQSDLPVENPETGVFSA